MKRELNEEIEQRKKSDGEEQGIYSQKYTLRKYANTDRNA